MGQTYVSRRDLGYPTVWQKRVVDTPNISDSSRM
ncbi:uncharacterized protein METZ01_LOCUS43669 [marine metagenome]|uniref:Uncharacterized protein n=1 Tax=marine metagenome TaxID=408172 RepID=A0A381RG80_9ZZZZ